MEAIDEEWISALMLAVAAAEQVMAVSEDLPAPSVAPIRGAATVLRDLAAREIERTRGDGSQGLERPI
ncbi:MAG TPA: hypothetical protein VFI04_01905 [Gaiellaceae bacterium]|nr:hypothetical protein [Gaiellaceae bacterium]